MSIRASRSPKTVPIRFSQSGTGPTLLLLHGVTRCGADWQPLVPALVASWNVITVDQRGHGHSPRATEYLVTDYVADAVDLISQRIPTPLVLFGHSLGAMVAAAVAAQLPDSVCGLVLEDPPLHTMGHRIEGSVWQAQFIGMRQAARDGKGAEQVARSLAEIRLPSSDGGYVRLGDLRDEASLMWSAECLMQLDPEALTPVIEGRWLDGYDLAAVLAGVRCPTLLLHADPRSGGALTDADAADIDASLRSCQHVRFPGCGHQLHRDRPGQVLQAVEEFTRTLDWSVGWPPQHQ